MEVTLSDLAALVGMILGTAGFVLGIVNYLRDRAKVVVKLRWDMLMAGGTLAGGTPGLGVCLKRFSKATPKGNREFSCRRSEI